LINATNIKKKSISYIIDETVIQINSQQFCYRLVSNLYVVLCWESTCYGRQKYVW